SVAFDSRICNELARVMAPAGLRDSILAERKIIRPIPWWNRRMGRPQMAAAAAVLLAGLIVSLWFSQRPATFAEFRREIADQSWGSAPHVEAKAADLKDVRNFLVSMNVETNFTIPSVLAQSAVHGCTLIKWRGHKVPVICFHSEGQHLHLVVVDRHLFPDAPAHVPQTDQWQSWRTASWSKDDHAYVLTGLNTTSFVKKFRREKRWDWEG
ncbi:MAG TPA: hypothetical protein VK846_11895, partial [Candidatus Limnocylindria bacterium]|nr:hypothetical protein [Candidatus Limnocylindria bacterium]